jgi:hypothetical protein
MCSLEEANEAYRYIGLPGYNPHVKSSVFFKHYNKKAAEHETILAKIEESKQLNLSNAHSDYHGNEKLNIENINTLSDNDKILLINSRRVFHIAEKGLNYVEREELARNYFDQVTAVEDSSAKNIQNYQNQSLLFQIYLVNKSMKDIGNIYGFRPIKKNSYLYHRSIKNGFLCGKFADLKKNIDWNYFPVGLPVAKEDILYICNPSYFKKNRRLRLSHDTKIDNQYKNDYCWCYWPDLD